MSASPVLSPINILQRLEQLKKWQESHDELLRKTKHLVNTTTASDYQTIEGLSAFDSTLSEQNSPKSPKNWESQVISPTKSFDQLLEEKLSQDVVPDNLPSKPKKPFLRKGSGLQRFRMKPGCKPKHNKKAPKTIERSVTPLRAPDLSVKPKATWRKIEESEDQIRRINELVHTTAAPPGDQTIYENALEKELAIFEALEQKADNSSFCSTNSSVVRILSSTPSKIKTVIEEKRVHWESDGEDVIETNLQKEDIAEILARLKNFQDANHKTQTSEDETSELSSCDSSVSSELESTVTSEKRDVAVGTTDELSDSCPICGDKLAQQIASYENKLDELIKDKNRIDELKKQLQQKERELMKKKREFEDEKQDLLLEVDAERKKLAKEKQVFQTYVKDSHNRPNKKERQEIGALKQEVADLSETLKLKESKNGMTQARLRNQIKQLEKDNSGLKDEVEKLTRTNAKLAATQKLNNRRPSDTKILHQINKNISKLAQGAFKDKDKQDSLIEMTNDDPLDLEAQYEHTFRNLSLGNTPKPVSPSDKTERILNDGSKQVTYASGNIKIVSPDGNLITVTYFNGDKQETNLLDGTVTYHFLSKNIRQTTHADGLEVIEFPNGVTEKRHVDGKCEVILSDGVVQTTYVDGTQETRYLDGSVVNVKANGDKVLLLPNGQREIETKEYKRREYPDGTAKILYPDGTLETKYGNGRVRIKDGNGTLILDTHT